MYTEFIIIYCLLAVSLIINVITMVVVLKNKSSVPARRSNSYSPRNVANDAQQTPPVVPFKPTPQVSVTFCRKCGNQFTSDMAVCPKCGTIR